MSMIKSFFYVLLNLLPLSLHKNVLPLYCLITSFRKFYWICLTDVSSEILEEHQELKEQVDAHGQAAAMEQVNSKFCFKTME